MIDPAVLHRIEAAIRSGTVAKFDVPLRSGERKWYYRELAYLGYGSTQIADATGWQVHRMQSDLQARREYRLTSTPDAHVNVDVVQVEVEQRPGSVLIHTPNVTVSVDGYPRDLAYFGRLVYGAATDQQESA